MTTIALTQQDRETARALLFKVGVFLRQGWTQGALARDRYGWPVSPDEEGAVCWCLGGALLAAAGLTSLHQLDSEDPLTRPAWVAESAIERAAPGWQPMTELNDKALSIYEVEHVVDLAVAWLSKEQG